MNDYFLKAASETELYSTLESLDLVGKYYLPEDTLNQKPEGADEAWVPTGKFNWFPKDIALDVIGTIYKPTGNMVTVDGPDGTTFEVPEQAPIDGYHANIRANLTEAQTTGLSSLLITAPKLPCRVWA